MAIKIRAVKNRVKTGDVVQAAVLLSYPHEVEEARAALGGTGVRVKAVEVQPSAAWSGAPIIKES